MPINTEMSDGLGERLPWLSHEGKALVSQLFTPSKSSQEASKQAAQAMLLTCHSTHNSSFFKLSYFILKHQCMIYLFYLATRSKEKWE